MGEVTTIGLDIGKRVLQVHAVDAMGRVIIQRKLRREEVQSFFSRLPRCLVGMEACATAHYWAREIAAFGHDTRLIPPAYVKPYVIRQKNDAADAAAICEAVTRPSVRTTPAKTIEQQAARVAHRTHELLSRQRVTLINAIRGHLAEFGILAPAGPQHVGRLIERLADPAVPIPDSVREVVVVDHVEPFLGPNRTGMMGSPERPSLCRRRKPAVESDRLVRPDLPPDWPSHLVRFFRTVQNPSSSTFRAPARSVYLLCGLSCLFVAERVTRSTTRVFVGSITSSGQSMKTAALCRSVSPGVSPR